MKKKKTRGCGASWVEGMFLDLLAAYERLFETGTTGSFSVVFLPIGITELNTFSIEPPFHSCVSVLTMCPGS